MSSPRAVLGPYELGPAIGAGGMGEVYRARDVRLGRDVAIKVLPSDVAGDPDRLRRFEQEARAAAALNHPNVLSVFDIGTADGVTYIVTELLQGRSLRAVVSAGVAVATALDYGAQIADGLTATHARGIIHRDIKPENLLVTTDGRVKILDFGLAKLAKAVDRDPAAPDGVSDTATGMILGTAGYMAPEQVRGQAVDARTDLFALGCVLYELLTAQRAFAGPTVMDTLGAVLNTAPAPVAALRTDVSPLLASVIDRCLAKDPADRFQSAADLAFALHACQSPVPIQGAAGHRSPVAPIAAFAAAGAIVAILILAMGSMWNREPDSHTAPALTFEIQASEGADRLVAPTLSADGGTLAFITGSGASRRVAIRPLTDRLVRTLERTADARYPFLSPDGGRLAFFADGALRVVSLSDGTIHDVCESQDARGGTWLNDDTVVFSSGPGNALSRVASTGGAPVPLTTLLPDEQGHRSPHALPGDAGVLFVVVDKAGMMTVAIVSPAASRHRLLLEGTSPKYDAGFLYFVNARGELSAASFDPVTGTVTGPVVVQLERPAIDFNIGNHAYAVAGGHLVHVPHQATDRTLRLVGAGVQAEVVPGPPRAFEAPRVSMAGDRYAVSIRPGTAWGDIWIGDFGGTLLPVTRDGRSRGPMWDVAGRALLYESSRSGHSRLYRQRVDDTASADVVWAQESYPSTVLRSGAVVIGAYNLPGRTSVDALFLLAPGAASPQPIPLGVSSSTFGRASPDGRWLAYTHRESGEWEVYLTTLADPGRPWPVSRAGSGREPVWSKSGHALYFLRESGEVMVVSIAPDGQPGPPRSAGVGTFPLSPYGAGYPMYDTTPDGRLLVAQPVDERSAPVPMVVSLNHTARDGRR